MSQTITTLPDGTIKTMNYAWVCVKCLKDNSSDCNVCECGGERTNVLTDQSRAFRDALLKAQRNL